MTGLTSADAVRRSDAISAQGGAVAGLDSLTKQAVAAAAELIPPDEAAKQRAEAHVFRMHPKDPEDVSLMLKDLERALDTRQLQLDQALVLLNLLEQRLRTAPYNEQDTLAYARLSELYVLKTKERILAEAERIKENGSPEDIMRLIESTQTLNHQFPNNGYWETLIALDRLYLGAKMSLYSQRAHRLIEAGNANRLEALISQIEGDFQRETYVQGLEEMFQELRRQHFDLIRNQVLTQVDALLQLPQEEASKLIPTLLLRIQGYMARDSSLPWHQLFIDVMGRIPSSGTEQTAQSTEQQVSAAPPSETWHG